MKFAILGPLEVTSDAGSALPIGARNLRLLLAAFLCQPNRAISVDGLVAAIWEDRPPRTAVKNLQVYVHELRQMLGADRIVRHSHGYSVRVGDDELDASRFRLLTARATSALAGGSSQTGRTLLSEALGLWRGPMLDDIADATAVQETILQLTEQRVVAQQAALEYDLRAGAGAAVVEEAGALAKAHPLRDPLRGLWMTALYRAGRAAEALQVYDDGRRMIADELGIEPSSDLQHIHVAILRGVDPWSDGATEPVPAVHADISGGPTTIAQLPADTTDFVGRQPLLDALDAWAVSASTMPMVLTGAAGMGKTTLAVHWAHPYTRRRGLGSLYLDLRGFATDTALQTVDALGFLLRSLGVSPESIPVDARDASALYRTAMANRRFVLILDNASSTQDIRALLPGGPGNLVLITSRDRLSGLTARQGARRIHVGPFEPAESVELLARMAALPAVPLAADTAAEVAALCGHLPLAIRIVAANMADGRYATPADLVAALSTSRSEWPPPLDLEDEPAEGLAAAFDQSFQDLDDATRDLFRMLGVLPVVDFTVASVAAAADRAAEHVRAQVGRMVGGHLLERRGTGRYAMHDLIHRYAASLGHAADPAWTQQARAGLYRFYLDHCDAVARLAYPQILRVPYQCADVVDVQFADQASALEWMDTERPNLVTVIRLAAADGQADVAWRLADMLRGYFSIRRHMADWLTVARTALESAFNAGDPAGEVAARLSLSMAQWWLGQRGEAIETLEVAGELAERMGWREAAVACVANLGGIYGDWGKVDLAAATLARALELHGEHGSPTTRANILTNLGAAYHDLGRLDESAAKAGQALAIYRELGLSLAAAQVESNLGGTLVMQGHFDTAGKLLARALETQRQLNEPYGQTWSMIYLARIRAQTGENDQARSLATEALELAESIESKNPISSILTLLGQISRDPQLHHRALNVARESGAGRTEAEAMLGLAETLLALGELPQAADWAQQCLAMSRAHCIRLIEGAAILALAEIRHAEGADASDVAGLAVEAAQVLRGTGSELHADRLRRLSVSPPP